jgi:hypothetical protein
MLCGLGWNKHIYLSIYLSTHLGRDVEEVHDEPVEEAAQQAQHPKHNPTNREHLNKIKFYSSLLLWAAEPHHFYAAPTQAPNFLTNDSATISTTQ